MNYSFLAGRANLNLGVVYNGDQTDWAFDEFFNRREVDLDSYTLVNLAGSYRIIDQVEIFGRIENLLDEEYEEVQYLWRHRPHGLRRAQSDLLMRCWPAKARATRGGGLVMALAVLALALAPPAMAAPERIVSLNLCTDALVLRLVPAERIASVTWLAHNPRASPVAALAGRCRGTMASPRRSCASTPISSWPASIRRGPPSPSSGESAYRSSRPMCRTRWRPCAPNREARGGARRRGAGPEPAGPDGCELRRPPAPPEVPPRAIVLNPNGFTVGRGSLVDEMLRRAGLVNIAAELGLESYGPIRSRPRSSPAPTC